MLRRPGNLLGRFGEADEKIRLVADAYVRRFGPEYPFVLAVRQLYSRTRSALDRTDVGIDLMADVVARRESDRRPGHPFTVASRRLLDEYRSGQWHPPHSSGGSRRPRVRIAPAR
ncbi:hypothetical protein [Streptomyces sp. NPDC093970]|uniref:hypothetical protein n=1 Tax=Streptomyces sp. NPDC093970 TaxID=3155076 RepID=UPI0034384D2B